MSHTPLLTRMFRAALLTITKCRKRPKCAPTTERRNDVAPPYLPWYHTHTAEHCSAVRDTDYRYTQQTGWMSKSLCWVTEASHKTVCCMIQFMWHLESASQCIHGISSHVGLPVEGERGHCKEHKDTGVMKMLSIVMGYTSIKIHQIVYFKWTWFIVCKLHWWSRKRHETFQMQVIL